MSGSAARVKVTPEFAAFTQEALDALSSRFLVRRRKEVLQLEFAQVAHCTPAAALSLFLHLEALGLAKVWAEAYEQETGTHWCRFPFSKGPPPLPVEIDGDDGVVQITAYDQLGYEISAVIKEPVQLISAESSRSLHE